MMTLENMWKIYQKGFSMRMKRGNLNKGFKHFAKYAFLCRLLNCFAVGKDGEKKVKQIIALVDYIGTVREKAKII